MRGLGGRGIGGGDRGLTLALVALGEAFGLFLARQALQAQAIGLTTGHLGIASAGLDRDLVALAIELRRLLQQQFGLGRILGRLDPAIGQEQRMFAITRSRRLQSDQGLPRLEPLQAGQIGQRRIAIEHRELLAQARDIRIDSVGGHPSTRDQEQHRQQHGKETSIREDMSGHCCGTESNWRRRSALRADFSSTSWRAASRRARALARSAAA